MARIILGVLAACLILASCTSGESLKPVSASTASGVGDFCQLITDQESRTCPEGSVFPELTEWGYHVHPNYIGIAENHCKAVADIGMTAAMEWAAQLDAAGKHVVRIANSMNCRGLGPASTSTRPRTTTTRSRTTTSRRPTTTASVQPQSVAYIDQLLTIEYDIRNLAIQLYGINQDWDNRTVGLSVTDAALVNAIVEAERILATFESITPSPSGHSAIRTKIRPVVTNTHRMLEGLRSPDAGEVRTESMNSLLEAVVALETEINRLAERSGYQNPPPRSIAVPKATTTTTTITRAVTTTITSPITTTTISRTGLTPDERSFCEIINQSAMDFECQDFHIDVAQVYCELVDETGDHGDAYDAMAPLMRAEGWVFGTVQRSEAEAAITAALLIDCRGF